MRRFEITLRFHRKAIGTIRDVGADQPAFYGTIALNSEGRKLKEFFYWMTDENNPLSEDPPFSEELLNDENWDILDGRVERPIFVPAIYPDNMIAWRDR